MFENQKHGLFAERIRKVLPVYHDLIFETPKQETSLGNIVNSAKSCAPYLGVLCSWWPNILQDLNRKPPEKIYGDLITKIDTARYDLLCKSLRSTKQQLHLLTALCDIAGIWSWEQVTEILSEFADIAMQALIKLVAYEMGFVASERGPVPGLFVLALGKYGGRELNYSSDIDLIVFYDPDHIKVPNPDNAERILVRFVKKLMRGFDEITGDGYVFRTDLRLRPDPRANAVAVSTLTAERYYETLGQNWERAAMIKARYCGGDEKVCANFIATILRPFIWRRSLDYAAIADIHSIKRQIQGDISLTSLSVLGHDVKLGLGGIREIEFFAQVQQLILGGRNKDLRIAKTVDVLSALGEGGYVDPSSAATMIEDYASLRNLEHRIQMYADKQTHIWPVEETHRLKLAHLSGYNDLEKFEQGMVDLFSRVHRVYAQLFAGEEDLSARKGSLVFTGVEIEKPTLSTFEAYGFLRGEMVWQEMANWLGGRIRATRSQRARELLTRLAPRIIEACGRQNSPDDAFLNFSIFLENLNSGVSMLSLFVSKPDALNSLIDILAIAPRLAHSLSAQPALIDAMVEPDFLRRDIKTSATQYFGLLESGCDFETSLDIIRRAVKEDQFNLSTSILRLQHLDRAGEIFSAIAQSAINTLLPKAVQETERLYGPFQGEYAVLALGKLGGQEMNLTSDLDIMLVYQSPDTGPSMGENISTLDNQAGQYNKLTRRLITALSSVTAEGGLYEVDMALRPSGRSGPLAVSMQAFQQYYANKAWTWEYMALSRARVVAASSDKCLKTVNHHIRQALAGKKYDGKLASDVLDMHGRLMQEKPAKGVWDIKSVAGGLRDSEFIAQYLMLKHNSFSGNSIPWQSTQNMLEIATKKQWIAVKDGKKLSEITSFYHTLLHIKAVAVKDGFDTDALPSSVKNLMAQSVGHESFKTLMQSYSQWREQVCEIFSRVIK